MLVENSIEIFKKKGGGRGICLSSCECPGVSVVNCSNDQLAKTADEHSVGKEDPTTAPFSDDAAVDNNNDDSDGGQDARVHEWTSNVGHLEEVCSVSCRLLA
jgi:hypothetical protein